MAMSKNFRSGSNPHNGGTISNSGQQQFGKGPKPGQRLDSRPSFGGGRQPSPAEKRAQAMRHGGSAKKGR